MSKFNVFDITSKNRVFVFVICVLIGGLLSSNIAYAQSTLSGAISLPETVTSGSSVFVEIRVDEFDLSLGLVESTREFLTVDSGVNEGLYSINYPTPTSGNELSISFRCSSNCFDVDRGESNFFHLQDDGNFSPAFNTVPLADFPANLNLQFPEPQALVNLSGTITLPSGVVSDGNTTVAVSVTETNLNGTFNHSSFEAFVVASGDNEVAYSIDYVGPSLSSEVEIRFLCSSGCFDVNRDQFTPFILQDDGSFGSSVNFVPVLDAPTTLNFQFPEPQTLVNLSGTIALPSGIESDGNISVEVIVTIVNQNGSFIQSLSERLQVDSQSSEVGYSIDYLEPALGSELQIQFRCRSNCFEVDRNGFTVFQLQDDGSFGSIFNTVAVNDVGTELNFQFPEPRPLVNLSGTITLPTGVTSDGGISIMVSLEERNVNGGFVQQSSERKVVGFEANEVDYNLSYIEPIQDSELVISFRCIGSCSEVDRGEFTSFVLQDDGSFDTDTNAIPVVSAPANLNFQFPEPPDLLSLNGTIVLPVGAVSDGRVLVSVNIAEVESNGDVVSSSSRNIFVTSGQNEQSFSLEYLEPAPGNELSIFFSCRFSCFELDRDQSIVFRLQDDGSVATSLNTIIPSDIPASVNLQFPEPQTLLNLTGTVTLPTGFVSEGDTSVLIVVQEVDSNGSFVRSSSDFQTVPFGDNQIAYSVDYLKPATDGSLVVRFSCNRGCFEVDRDRFTSFFLQGDGSFAPSLSTVTADSVPADLNFQFPEPQAILNLSGTISLPNGRVSDGNITIEVTITEVDVNGNFVLSSASSSVVAFGDNEVSYSVDYLDPAVDSELEIRFQCRSNCIEVDRNQFTNFRLQDDGSVTPGRNEIAAVDAPETLNFQFPDSPALVNLSGRITLPTGVLSDGGLSINVRLEENDADGNFVQQSSDFSTVAFRGNQVEYSIDYLEPDLGSELIISVTCSGGCFEVDRDQFTLFILQDDGSLSTVSNTIDATDVPSTLDVQFPEPPAVFNLSGEISLPTGVVADGDVFIGVSLEEGGLDGGFVRSSFEFVTVPSGDNQAEYSIDYIEPASGNDLTIQFNCNNNCFEVDRDRFTSFFLQDDGSFSRVSNFVSASGAPTTLDFQFPAPPAILNLSGTITLPPGVVSDGNTSIDVALIEVDINGNFVRSLFDSPIVASGDDETTYSIDYIEPAVGNKLEIRFSCFTNCFNVDRDQSIDFRLQDDGSFSSIFNQVVAIDVPAELNFEFPEPSAVSSLSGTITLPAGVVSDGNISVVVTVLESDDRNSFVRSRSDVFKVASGDTDLFYSLAYIEPDSGNLLDITFTCSSGCTEVDRDQFASFRLQDDGSFNRVFNTIPASSAPATLNFQFPEPPAVLNLSGIITLPINVFSIGNTSINVSLRETDLNGSTVRSSSGFSDVAAGDNDVAYSIDYLEPAPGNNLIIRFGCGGNCDQIDGNQFTSFFLQDDGSFSAIFNQVAAVEVPPTLDFQFPELITLTGNISLPGEVLQEEIRFNVSINEIDEQGNFLSSIGFVSGLIPAGNSSADFQLSSNTVNFNGSYNVTYGCSAFSSTDCGTLVTTTLIDGAGNPVFLSNEAIDFPVAGSDLNSLLDGLILQQGEFISGEIRLPNALISDTEISVSVEAFGDTVDLALDNLAFIESSSFLLEAGQAVGNFNVFVPPILSNSGIRISARCSNVFGSSPDQGRACGALLDVHYFNSQGTEAFEVNAEILRGDSQLDDLVIPLIEGREILVQGALPNLDTFPESVFMVLVADIVTDTGDILSRTIDRLTIQAGSLAGVPTPIVLAEPPVGAAYRFRFSCSPIVTFIVPCDNFIDPSFFSLSGTRFSSDDPLILIGSDQVPDLVRLELVPATPVRFVILPPVDGPTVDRFLSFDFNIELLDEFGGVIETQQINRFFPPMTLDGSLTLLNFPEGRSGSYRVSFACTEETGLSCDSLVEADPSYSVTFDENAIPDLLTLQLLFEPLVIDPDAFEVDNTPNQANALLDSQVQTHSIHEEGDEDWLTFSIQQLSNVSIISRATSEQVSVLEMTLFDESENQLATDIDETTDAEANDPQLLSIDLDNVEPGTFLLRVRTISPINLVESYNLELSRSSAQSESESDDESETEVIDDTLCFPIVTPNGSATVICL